jgi:hypothetical protein
MVIFPVAVAERDSDVPSRGFLRVMVAPLRLVDSGSVILRELLRVMVC